jgi:hypothetical protein
MDDLVQAGDLDAMSLRWSATRRPVPRTSLKSSHPAFVDDKDDDSAKRWGLFFSHSLAKEGSLVGLGADPKALVGRADLATSDGEKAFFTFLARSQESEEGDNKEIPGAFEQLSKAIKGLRDLSVEDVDLANMLSVESGVMVPFAYRDAEGENRRILIPRDAWDSLRGESLEEFRAALLIKGDVSERKPDEKEEEKEEVESKPRTLSDLSIEEFEEANTRSLASAVEGVMYHVFGKVQ